MNKDIKDRWISALRSGGFKQCKGKLCLKENDTYFYCVLGVLHSIYDGMENLNNAFDLNFNEIINKWSGINNEQRCELVRMNDNARKGEGKNFSQLADYIERNF